MANSVNPSFCPLWLALILLLFALLAPSPARGTAAAGGAGQTLVESPSVLDGPPLYLPLVMGGNGSTAPPTGDFQLQAFSDALRLDPLAEMEADLNMVGPLYCLTNGLPAPATLTLAQARQNAQGYLQQLAGSAAVDGVRSHLANRSLGEIDSFATAAGAAGETDAALAALLIAVEMFPGEPMPLVNAAGLLSNSGLPNEAISFLDAAAATGKPYGSPMGVDGEQIAANNRAHALLMRGQWAEAEAILRAVVVAEPQLAEARMNLSRALLCQNENAEAARWYRMAQRRMVWDVVKDGPEIRDEMIPIDHLYDTSAGQLLEVPDIPKPVRPEQVGDFYLLYQQMNDDYHTTLDTLGAMTPALEQAYKNRTLPFLQQSRLDSIMGAFNRVHEHPEVAALWAQSIDLLLEMVHLWSSTNNEIEDLFVNGGDDETCRAMLRAHFNEYLPVWYEHEDVIQEYMRLEYAMSTGVLANAQDVPLHNLLMNRLQSNMATGYNLNVELAWSHWFSMLWEITCGGSGEASDETDSEMATPAAEQCPAGVKGVKLGAEFGIAQISITCEIVEVELSESAPISPFLQVTHDMRKNEATFFFGAKGKVMIGPLLELNAKEGFYVRANQTSITDVGMKTATGGAVHLGGSGISGQLDGPEFEMGVAAAVEYWLGP
jgi:tetratricopeptide (TPR) repeat protein